MGLSLSRSARNDANNGRFSTCYDSSPPHGFMRVAMEEQSVVIYDIGNVHLHLFEIITDHGTARPARFDSFSKSELPALSLSDLSESL